MDIEQKCLKTSSKQQIISPSELKTEQSTSLNLYVGIMHICYIAIVP